MTSNPSSPGDITPQHDASTDGGSARPRRLRAAALAVVAAAAFVVGLAVVAPAGAAPYINCNRPIYHGSSSASVRCDAASTGKVRLKARCWIGPVPVAEKYTSWVTIPAGQYRVVAFVSNGWCTSFGQQWEVSPQIG